MDNVTIESKYLFLFCGLFLGYCIRGVQGAVAKIKHEKKMKELYEQRMIEFERSKQEAIKAGQLEARKISKSPKLFEKTD